MKWKDLYSASGERADISPKLDCNSLLEEAVTFFLSANADPQPADRLISRVPKHVIMDIDNITTACIDHIITNDYEEPDSITSLSGMCACYGLCFGQTDSKYLSFSSYDDYYDRAKASLGFEYSPDCCDYCQVPEEECSVDDCEKVKKHNAFIMLLRNAFGGSALDILHLPQREGKVASFEFYKASLLYGVIIGIYYIQDNRVFDIE